MDASTFLRQKLEARRRTVVPSQPRDASYTTWTRDLAGRTCNPSTGSSCVTFLPAPITLPGCGYGACGTGGSLAFVGAAPAMLSVANDASLRFGTGDFSVEWWQRMQFSEVTAARVFSIGNFPSATFAVSMERKSASAYTAYTWVDGVTPAITAYLSTAQVEGQWLHCAVTRSGSTLAAYAGGACLSSVTCTFDFADSAHPLTIGAEAGPNTGYTGDLTNFRIVQGTAVYAGPSYAVPQSPLGVLPSTSLLLLAAAAPAATLDSSPYAHAVSDDGATWDAATPFS
jgi:hypothetical protein